MAMAEGAKGGLLKRKETPPPHLSLRERSSAARVRGYVLSGQGTPLTRT